MNEYKIEYDRWLKNAGVDELRTELLSMDEKATEDAFYRELDFGTGGLRGLIGAGTNRMNVYVVAKASQGISNYLKAGSSVVVGYDSRNKSDTFARVAASVFAANGHVVHFWPKLFPVPTVSYAIRYLGATQGIMITASHNPAKYNGYKVYDSNGAQITPEVADAILAEINGVDIFDGVKIINFDDAVGNGKIKFIDPTVFEAYISDVKSQSLLFGDKIDRDIKIVYTPLNGTGLLPVTRILKETGFNNVTVVEEQRNPDGNFTYCPYPNPEEQEAMQLGLKYCKTSGAELLLATDPDADRCGVAVRGSDGSYQLLSGNEIGLLLLDYICSQRIKHSMMPEHAVFAKTIVTTDLAETIANHYGVETINVLTGFKFIGEVIGKLEKLGRTNDFIFGFEESCGYLTGSYVRDKDGVNAVFLISEMFSFYKSRGISLIDKLEELYTNYGYCLNTLNSYTFSGPNGNQIIGEVMDKFRNSVTYIGGNRVIKIEDYSTGINGLPKSNVLKFYIENGSVVLRPSGTEPKLKTYVSVMGNNKNIAKTIEQKIRSDLDDKIIANNICIMA